MGLLSRCGAQASPVAPSPVTKLGLCSTGSVVTGLAVTEAIPRQVDRKSGVCEEESGSLGLTKRRQGSGILKEEGDKRHLFLYIP